MQLELVTSLLISDFPSASSINYSKGKLYVTGDDATTILVLNCQYEKLESIQLFDYSDKRIPKAEKADLEAAVVVELNSKTELLVFGSGSKKERKQMIRIPISGSDIAGQTFQTYSTKEFISRIKGGIQEVNLEGATLFQNRLMLGNRGNRSNPKNHLIITSIDFWNHQEEADFSIMGISLPDEHSKTLCVSELCFVESMDLLLITLSSEASDNAYDDGAIGHSYLAWINNFSDKIFREDIEIDGLASLADCHADFNNEKIEGMCVESILENVILLHLTSDNDNGSSRLFKVSLKR